MRKLAFAAALAALLTGGSTALQEPARRVVQQGPARLAAQPAEADPAQIRQALRSPAARADLAANVRGIDINEIDAALAYRQLRANARTRAPADASDEMLRPGRRLNAAQLQALQSAPQRRSASPNGNLAPQATVDPSAIRRATTTTSPTRTPQRVSPNVRAPVTARPTGPGANLAAPPMPYLDVDGFGQDLHAALSNSTNGYVMRMIRGGQTIYTLQWDWAQRPQNGGTGWNPDRRMHIASVSKFITAMALVDLLDREGISVNSPIAPWLPDYWAQGSNIEDITFAHLLTHRSGFSTGGSTSNYSFMRQQVAAGVPFGHPAGNDYENMNFGLARILIATIGGYVNTSYDPGFLMRDPLWDLITLMAYVDYVETRILAPSGVTGAGLVGDSNTAYAYTWTGGNAWLPGDLSDWAGGASWHMSINDVLRIAHRFRRAGSPISRPRATEILQLGFGVDGFWNSPAGRVYHKNGIWRDRSACNGRSEEQSLLLLMPGDMEMALYVNSPVGPSCTFLRDLVQTTYLNNVVDP
jgi:CubicO group peptidase (beta-lactamase class C family)